MKKHKIAIIFDQMGLGGVQRKIVDLASVMSNKSEIFKIVIILKQQKNFELLKQISCKKTQIYYHQQAGLISKLPFSLFVLWIVLKENVDSILAFLDISSHAAIFVKKIIFWKDLRVVLCEDAIPSFYTRYHHQLWQQWMISSNYQLADCVICPTSEIRRELSQIYHVSDNLLTTIPNWTNFQPEKDIEKKYDFLFAGRFEKQKNLALLIRLFKKITLEDNSLSLLLIGEGNLEQDLKKITSEMDLEDNIIFKAPTHYIKRIMQQSKLTLLTSLYEGMPLSALESMAVGTPVISKNYPGVSDLIFSGKNGFIADTDEDFVKICTDLINNDKKRVRLSVSTRRVANEQFSINRALEYQEIILGSKESCSIER